MANGNQPQPQQVPVPQAQPRPQAAPVAPMAPQQAGQQGGGQPVSEEKRQQLMQLLQATRTKVNDMNAARFVAQNSSDVERREALKQAFQALEQAGVDLNDPAAVREFIEKLKQQNPEYAQLFEEAMAFLLGDNPEVQKSKFSEPIAPPQGMQQAPGQVPGGGNMNIGNEAIPEDIRGPAPGGAQAPGVAR